MMPFLPHINVNPQHCGIDTHGPVLTDNVNERAVIAPEFQYDLTEVLAEDSNNGSVIHLEILNTIEMQENI